MKRLFSVSRWMHKYIGLLLLPVLAWMSLSGILLNHPSLIDSYSVGGFLLPPQYKAENWNRSSLLDIEFINNDRKIICGKQGIWEISGTQVNSMMAGEFPTEPLLLKTYDIELIEADPDIMLAATDGGLFVCNLKDKNWQKLDFPYDEHLSHGKTQGLKKIHSIHEHLLIMTNSNVLQASIPVSQIRSFANNIDQLQQSITFSEISLMRDTKDSRISLVRLFFALHDGSMWGLPGRLLYDFSGIVLFFLSLSAFYLWYYPRKMIKRAKVQKDMPEKLTKARVNSGKRKGRLFRFLLKYHLKLGIWLALILLLVAGTGLFMRPPLLVVLTKGSIAEKFWPGHKTENPWDGKLKDLFYDSQNQRLLISADGFWQAPWSIELASAESSFYIQNELKPELLELDVPVFVMGTTVFSKDKNDELLVGSFNGLYAVTTGEPIRDYISGTPPVDVSNVKPGEYMVTGFFTDPKGQNWITTHEQGLVCLEDHSASGLLPAMPDSLSKNGKIPLWNWLFELHNGRIFKDLLSGFYILLVPFSAMLFLLISVTGIYDWIWKFLRRRLKT
jgi:uncharacterized iron-regulated membrane protein